MKNEGFIPRQMRKFDNKTSSGCIVLKSSLGRFSFAFADKKGKGPDVSIAASNSESIVAPDVV